MRLGAGEEGEPGGILWGAREACVACAVCGGSHVEVARAVALREYAQRVDSIGGRRYEALAGSGIDAHPADALQVVARVDAQQELQQRARSAAHIDPDVAVAVGICLRHEEHAVPRGTFNADVNDHLQRVEHFGVVAECEEMLCGDGGR